MARRKWRNEREPQHWLVMRTDAPLILQELVPGFWRDRPIWVVPVPGVPIQKFPDERSALTVSKRVGPHAQVVHVPGPESYSDPGLE